MPDTIGGIDPDSFALYLRNVDPATRVRAMREALGGDLTPSPEGQREHQLGQIASIIGMGNQRMGQIGQALTTDVHQQESLRQGNALKMALAGINGGARAESAYDRAVGGVLGQGLRAQSAEQISTDKNTSQERIGRGHDAARVAAANALSQGRGTTQSVKDLIQFGKDVDPESNPGLKPYRDLAFQADRLSALGRDPEGTIKNLDPSQMEELGLGLHRIFTGANRTVQAQVAALVPHTAMSDAQAFKRWFANEPTGTNQQAFVRMMLDTIDREKAVSAGRLHNAQVSAALRHAPTLRGQIGDAIPVMKAVGLDPDEVMAQVAGAGPAAPAAPAVPPAAPPKAAKPGKKARVSVEDLLSLYPEKK